MAAQTDKLYLGIDTSCYTTSAACVSEAGIVQNVRTMLRVRLGETGLRQSDAVFQHMGNLGELLPRLLSDVRQENIAAAGVSSAPRDAKGSYMPVFLAGVSAARITAAALSLPLYQFSHQAGHIRAALMGNESLLGRDFLALHLSGGTTEVARVSAGGGSIGSISLLGGTEDLHAGQFVDRVGVALGLPFPAGREMEALARGCTDGGGTRLPSRVKGLTCSFSGVETAAQRLLRSGAPRETVAFSVYDCLARTVSRLIINAAEAAGLRDALLCGGVAGSLLLRELLKKRMAHAGVSLHYGKPELSGDNAVGVALLARDSHTAGEYDG